MFDPALSDKSDKEAADKLPLLMKEFLQSVGLYYSFSQLGLTEEELKLAEASPIFNFLPFAPKEVMVGILHDSYEF